MNANELIAYAARGAEVAVEVAALFTRATLAANNGDMVAAEAYLSDARGRWDAAAAGWTAAPGPSAEPAPEPAPMPPAEPTA